MRSTCYFSYSWDDADEIFMQQLKNQIEKLSRYEVDVLYDRNKLKIGDELSTFEDEMDNADLIVLFLTPSFKSKVLKKDVKYGAYREYKKILKRRSNGFEYVLPILVSGDTQESVLSEFENIIYEDINKVINRYSTIAKTKQVSFSREFNVLIQRIAKLVIGKTKASAWLREHQYISFEEEYNKLFLNTAAAMMDSTFPASCIVKMDAYDLVLREQTDLVIGRKGSGKTTFLNMIYRYNPIFFQKNYKNPAPISAETFNLEYAYKALVGDIKEDFEIFPMEKVLDVFWEVLFVLQCIYNVYIDMRDYKIQDDDRLPNFKKVIKIFEYKLGNIGGDLSSNHDIFTLAVELVSNYIHTASFKNANPETLIASVVNNFSAIKILENVFNQNDFSKFCQNIYRCNHKIFISIDGYDTQSADFRRRTRELLTIFPQTARRRKEFEVLLYRELLYTIYNLKNRNATNFSYINKLFYKVHFCVIIPQDKYDEIRIFDRDIEKRKKCCLNWDAYDLFEMLVKRLEFCYGLECKNEENLQARFENIMNAKLPNIPKTITIEIEGIDYEISLFNYMLRLSFWRPRDIIINFSRIMKLGKEKLALEKTCIQEVVKDLLTNSAREIIQNEFLNEYNNTFEDLKFILHAFEGDNLIIEAQEFYEKLSKVPFILSSGKIENTDEKIMLLYKLGVIGLYYNHKTQEDKKLIRDYGFGYHICFVFNEGLQPIENFLAIDITKAREKFIFNPIFAKYLMLNYNTEEIIGNYGFDYIKTNHLMKDSIRRM